MTAPSNEDDWLWGWDPTPGIVSVWAEHDGRATVWRRDPETKTLVREEERFRPWLLLDTLDDLRHLGPWLAPEGTVGARVWWRGLDGTGPGTLRFLVSADDGRELTRAVLDGAARRLGGGPVRHLKELGDEHVLALPPEERYLVATGRTYFRGSGKGYAFADSAELRRLGVFVAPRRGEDFLGFNRHEHCAGHP